MSTPAVTSDPYAAYGGAVASGGGADPYAAYGGSVAAPAAASPEKSLLQKAKDGFRGIQDSFDANTKTSPNEPLLETGLKSVVGTIGAPFVHPVAAAQSFQPQSTTEMVLGPAATAARQLFNAGKGVVADYKEGGAAYAATKAAGAGVGAIALGKAAGAAPEAIAGAAELPGKLYPTSRSLVADTSAARNLSRALIVDPAGVNNFVNAATDEAGTVVGYARDNGIPINSKVDFANAAKQTADVVQQHFDALLEPNAKTVVSVPPSFEGPKVGEGNNATLGAVNARINAISSELKSNFRKSLSSQTSAANTSDADLIAEKNALTNVLHKNLSAATGLPPDAIADLRVQAGKLRTIADESMASANRDLTAAGKQAMGTTTSAVGTKAGLIDRGMQMVQGGPEIIGNRQVLGALRNVTPKALNLPTPPTP